MLVGAWPASFVFFAGYTEALAVALMVWAVVLGAGRALGVGGGVRFCCRVDAVGGNAGVVPLAIMALAAAQRPGTMAGRDRSARIAGILVLVAADRDASECGSGLSDVSGITVRGRVRGRRCGGRLIRWRSASIAVLAISLWR